MNRMRDGEPAGRLRHAAPLHHGEKNMKVPQFDPVADAIRPLHFGTYLKKLQARRKLELVTFSQSRQRFNSKCEISGLRGIAVSVPPRIEEAGARRRCQRDHRKQAATLFPKTGYLLIWGILP
jgi:hypothetical protein